MTLFRAKLKIFGLTNFPECTGRVHLQNGFRGTKHTQMWNSFTINILFKLWQLFSVTRFTLVSVTTRFIFILVLVFTYFHVEDLKFNFSPAAENELNFFPALGFHDAAGLVVESHLVGGYFTSLFLRRWCCRSYYRSCDMLKKLFNSYCFRPYCVSSYFLFLSWFHQRPLRVVRFPSQWIGSELWLTVVTSRGRQRSRVNF